MSRWATAALCMATAAQREAAATTATRRNNYGRGQKANGNGSPSSSSYSYHSMISSFTTNQPSAVTSIMGDKLNEDDKRDSKEKAQVEGHGSQSQSQSRVADITARSQTSRMLRMTDMIDNRLGWPTTNQRVNVGGDTQPGPGPVLSSGEGEGDGSGNGNGSGALPHNEFYNGPRYGAVYPRCTFSTIQTPQEQRHDGEPPWSGVVPVGLHGGASTLPLQVADTTAMRRMIGGTGMTKSNSIGVMLPIRGSSTCRVPQVLSAGQQQVPVSEKGAGRTLEGVRRPSSAGATVFAPNVQWQPVLSPGTIAMGVDPTGNSVSIHSVCSKGEDERGKYKPAQVDVAAASRHDMIAISRQGGVTQMKQDVNEERVTSESSEAPTGRQASRPLRYGFW